MLRSPLNPPIFYEEGGRVSVGEAPFFGSGFARFYGISSLRLWRN